jgi:hypothetical protein
VFAGAIADFRCCWSGGLRRRELRQDEGSTRRDRPTARRSGVSGWATIPASAASARSQRFAVLFSFERPLPHGTGFRARLNHGHDFAVTHATKLIGVFDATSACGRRRASGWHPSRNDCDCRGTRAKDHREAAGEHRVPGLRRIRRRLPEQPPTREREQPMLSRVPHGFAPTLSTRNEITP